jgi:nucleotide-binding universal stress UspA family protein
MQFERILVPVDFSQLSKRALTEAVTLAGDADVKLTVLHVHEQTDTPTVDPAYRPERVPDRQPAIVKTLQEQLASFVKGVTDPVADAQLSVVSSPSAVRTIIDATGDHDLVVLATHGRAGLGQFLLGSVTERVVRGARCSALVVRPPDE